MVRRLLTGLLLLPVMALAATISVETDRDPVDQEEAFQLIFLARGTPDGEPDFSPLERDFEILGHSTSVSINMINGAMERNKRWILTLMARRAGTLLIPSIAFGKDRSPPKRVTVRPGGARDSRAARDVRLEVELRPKNPYPGAQVTLSLRFLHAVPVVAASVSDPEITEGDARILQLGRDLHYQRHRQGRSYEVTERRYALFPRKSGRLGIKPLLLSARLASRRGRRPGLNELFNPALAPRVVRRSGPLELKVRPIPKEMQGLPWLPASDLTLQEEWEGVDGPLKTGEPIKRRIHLLAAGTEPGLVPEIRLRADGWKVYPDRSKLQSVTAGSNLVASRQQSFALIPTRPGTLTLPAVEVVWWNTVEDRREVATLPARSFRVTGPPLQAEPEPQQPVALQDATPPDPDEAMEPEDRWSINVPGSLSLLALVALLALLGWRRRGGHGLPMSPGRPGRPSLRKAMKHLRQACAAGDPRAASRALQEWAGARWPETGPISLEGLAARLGTGAAREIRELQRVLYAGEAAAWDGTGLWREISTLRDRRDKAGMHSPPDELPPLYRL